MSPPDPVVARGIVIAIDPRQGVFAVQARDGQCAVFLRLNGPTVMAGDLLDGALLDARTDKLVHADGMCEVTSASGPLTRSEALARVYGLRQSKSAATPAARPVEPGV
ncbi:MAG: hypothetical protein Q7T87_16175 [Polaromonas sp.]|nr:hypothetical protein [Polaromonas sp.]